MKAKDFNKGSWCPYSAIPVFCQEGYCDECDIWQNNNLIDKKQGSKEKEKNVNKT
jgi:hypothetical protein